MTFLLETLRLGLKNIMLHKLRSLLTALGIIFGVAAVILMVAIGEGNKQKALADIEKLGTRNIILRSVQPPESGDAGEGAERLNSYGLLRTDLKRITRTVAALDHVVPLKQVGARVYQGARRTAAKVYGVPPELKDVTSLRVARGRFVTELDGRSRANVAVLGHEVAERLYPLDDPIGRQFRVDNHAFVVVGVLEPVGLAGGAGASLVGRDLNFDVYTPYQTARTLFGDMRSENRSGTFIREEVELHEVVLQVAEDADVLTVAQQVERIIDVGHADQQDVTVVVPLELLEQQARTLALFNFLMAAIAAISLLVGGIGIMNIMLASVTERTREIGIRRALGATRRHIVAQFLTETTVLSGLGGAIGVATGIGFAIGLSLVFVWWPSLGENYGAPDPPLWVVVLAFGVATSVGVIFGLYPAVKAAQQDPIVALRHE